MRRAHSDINWLIGDSNEVIGFSLGYDFCSEHEHGAPYMRAAMGISHSTIPVGIEDRKMTSLYKEAFGLVEYTSGVSKKNPALSRVPHALMYLSEDPQFWSEKATTYKQFVSGFNVQMYSDATSKNYNPERDDIAVVWSDRGGFAINVRGEENVKRLKELHRAMLDLDVALMAGASLGFLRKAMALVIVSNAPADKVVSMKEKDLAIQRLYQAAADSKIEQALKEAGCKHYALSPGWRAGVEAPENLMFLLNPVDQRAFHHGWYTVGELQEWTKGRGPIVDGRTACSALEKTHGKDYGYNVVHRANQVDIGLNYKTEVWLDEAKTQAGVRVLFSKNNAVQYADGNYSLDQLHAMFDAIAPEKVAA